MVTVAIFQRWYSGAVQACFPLDKWSLLPIRLSKDTLSAEIDQLRQQAREGTTAAIDQLFDGADEYGFLRMIDVDGHNGLEVWVKLRRTDRLQVTVVYWPNEPFGDLFLQRLHAEWPELEDWRGDAVNFATMTPDAAKKQYWEDIRRRAQASGNVRQTLKDLDISPSTYYENTRDL